MNPIGKIIIILMILVALFGIVFWASTGGLTVVPYLIAMVVVVFAAVVGFVSGGLDIFD